jgi:2-polyprenyl-3-methyl-5-hydroxy-6-metoxy-1,4-benzoquinol methylase
MQKKGKATDMSVRDALLNHGRAAGQAWSSGMAKDTTLLGNRVPADVDDFSDHIATEDHKLKFVMQYARGKSMLDIGCVQHNPANYQSKYWLHKALRGVSRDLVGIDLYRDGVTYLRSAGYNVQVADAQAFDLGRTFEVIVACDLIEHLENFDGFLESCKRHLAPGGRLLISTPNPWYWRNVLKAALTREVANNPEHTCWLCVRTLRQLVRRHGMDIGEVVFGSRYLRDRLMPLPRGWKHTSFHAEILCKNT